jgi:hypothetical protein
MKKLITGLIISIVLVVFGLYIFKTNKGQVEPLPEFEHWNDTLETITPTSTPSATPTFKPTGKTTTNSKVEPTLAPKPTVAPQQNYQPANTTYNYNVVLPTNAPIPTVKVDNSGLIQSLITQRDNEYSYCISQLESLISQRDAEVLVFTREMGRRGISTESQAYIDAVNAIYARYADMGLSIQSNCDNEIARINAQIVSLQ